MSDYNDLPIVPREALINVRSGLAGRRDADVLAAYIRELREVSQRWSDWHNEQVAAGRFEAREKGG